MDVIILRFEAPLLSFGAPIVDQEGKIQPFPARSMITGLTANALGFDHREFDRLQNLQERISHASRCDRRGEKIQDFQRVDLGQDFMKESRAWTTRGKIEERAGGNKEGLHIRHRDYWADSAHTVALTLDNPQDAPTLDDIAEAFQEPERPLFIGRKACLPAENIYLGDMEADSLKEALRKVPLTVSGRDSVTDAEREAWWPVDHPEAAEGDAMVKPVTDRRDWSNQIHTGERWLAHGRLAVDEEVVSVE